MMTKIGVEKGSAVFEVPLAKAEAWAQQRMYLIEVKGWFAKAQRSSPCWINLWFLPLSKIYFKITKRLLVFGVDTGLIEYEGHLYRQDSGPGDFELRLHYVGRLDRFKQAVQLIAPA